MSKLLNNIFDYIYQHALWKDNSGNVTIPGSLTTGSLTTENLTTGSLTTGSLTIGTRPINDYVIEEHIATTDTNWSWRKWNSGIAECWKRFYSGTFAPTFTLGGGFYARVLGPFELPSGLFTTIPFGNFDFTYWGNTYFWGSLRNVTATEYSLTVFKYGNESHVGYGSLYFIGT